MADYVRATLVLEQSQVSDYVPGKRTTFELEWTAAQVIQTLVIADTTPGVTFTTSHLTSASGLALHNRSTTITVTATVDTDGLANVPIILTPGQFVFVPDFDPAGDIVLVAASSTADCDVVVFGA